MEHRCYFGKTQSGKTTKAVADLKSAKSYGKLFINLIDNKQMVGFEQVSKKTDIDLIINLLKNKRCVQYNCHEDTFSKEVIALKKIAYMCENVIFLLDEAHLINKETEKEIEKIWTGGRHRNIYGWAISQRPQLMSRTMLTQSKLFVFRLDLEDSWLKSYGIKETPKEDYKYVEY